MHVHSDLLTARFPLVERPPNIRPPNSHVLFTLVDYATDRMSIAVNLLPPDATPARCRIRLCHWWLDIGSKAYELKLGPTIIQALEGTPLDHYSAIGKWMDGRWSSRRRAMTDFLWRLHMTDRVVSAAAWLHDRAALREWDDETKNDRATSAA